MIVNGKPRAQVFNFDQILEALTPTAIVPAGAPGLVALSFQKKRYRFSLVDLV